ncbi:hypothetical protein NDA16_003673 [Ustilago loliicola]|nr:hypothetical protein NDA16_003673 [Ustilago loliicola]
MHFPNSLLAFVLTSLLLNPSSGVEAKPQPKPFGNEVQDVTRPDPSNNFGAILAGVRRRRSYDEMLIRSPKAQLECDPGHPVRGCVPPAAAAEAAKLSKRSPLQISNDEGNPLTDGGQGPGAGAKVDKTVLIPGGFHHPTPNNHPSSFPFDTESTITPSTITITSSLFANHDLGFFGICKLPFSANDGVVNRTNALSPVSKFLDAAKKTATCTYYTDSNIDCMEKGGAQGMKESDYTWWKQSFCKRCVDAGGESRAEFPCPDGYSHGNLEVKPTFDSTPILNKDGLKTGVIKGTLEGADEGA